jgi:hypothetical protein
LWCDLSRSGSVFGGLEEKERRIRAVTLDELSETLPNGFHDAQVTSLHIDYVYIAANDAELYWRTDVERRNPV